MKLSTLSLVIPCYNDAATIAKAISEARELGQTAAGAYEILVANDASSDESGAILEALAAKNKDLQIITHPRNVGYGATIWELYYAARREWLFSIPGDFQIGARELLKLIPESDKADMIVGWRVDRQDPAARLRQSKIYNTLLRLLFGLTLHDVNSVRLLRTSVLKNITLTSTSAFVDAELTIRMKRLGLTVAEVAIDHRGEVGDAGGGGSLATILPTIADMLRFWLLGS